MAIFAANRCLRFSLGIQPRTLLVFSLAKKGYNTSGPVRYIPKSRIQIEKIQKAQSLESCDGKDGILFGNRTSEGKRGDHKLPKRDEQLQSSLFHGENANPNEIFEQVEKLPELDDTNSSAFELMDTDVGSMSELSTDESSNYLEDTTSESDDLLTRNVRQDAEKFAIELLASRAYTELELRRKLRGKKYPSNIVESVIADIKCRGLLNDGLYAESFSRSRWLSSTWGPKRIKHALVQKGVIESEAEKATKLVFEGEDIDGDSPTVQYGMSKVAMDRLFVQASKQWQRGHNISQENRKARIVRWLQYRGFSWGVTNAILKKLEEQYPL